MFRRARADKNDNRVLRRFFKRLKERVGALDVEIIRVVDHRDAPSAQKRRLIQRVTQPGLHPFLFRADEQFKGKRRFIGGLTDIVKVGMLRKNEFGRHNVESKLFAAVAFPARAKAFEEFFARRRRIKSRVADHSIPFLMKQSLTKQRLREHKRKNALSDALRTDEKKTPAESSPRACPRKLQRDLVRAANALPAHSYLSCDPRPAPLCSGDAP